MNETWEIIELAAVAVWLLLPVAVALYLEHARKGGADHDRRVH